MSNLAENKSDMVQYCIDVIKRSNKYKDVTLLSTLCRLYLKREIKRLNQAYANGELSLREYILYKSDIENILK